MHSANAPTIGGITAENRDRLARLHRQLGAPFTVAEASRVLDDDPERTRKFLAYLAARGWLARVRRDLYVPVPLEATVPAEWREDPWIVATKLFAPCYIGGWSACEHWGLTEQIFRAVIVITARVVRDRHPEIQGTSYHLKTVAEQRLFGTEVVWHGRVRMRVSDPSRTLVDMLDDPSLGGGIRHVAEIVSAYFARDARDDRRLLEYARRLGNRTVFKRLGYLAEALGVEAPELVRACLNEMSTGISDLDPSLPRTGRIVRRWNLRANPSVATEGMPA